MNKRNLGHWLILIIVILVIGGGIGTIHLMDLHAKQEVAAQNHHRTKVVRQWLLALERQSQKAIQGQSSAFNVANSGHAAPKFAAQVDRNLNQKKFNGTALVIKNDQVVFQKAYGYANAKRHQKNTAQSMYQINSVQKSLTAGLVMKAVAAGKLNLSDHLSQYYPHIKHANQITLRQMLNMTSGMTGSVKPTRPLTEKQMIKFAKDHATIHIAQINHFKYEPINYVLLAGVLRQVTHTSYYKLFYTELVTPLHLADTSFVQIISQRASRTIGYGGVTPRQYASPMFPAAKEQNGLYATGNAYMSAGDLWTAERAVLGAGGLLSKTAATELHQPQQALKYAGGLYHLPDNTGYYSHGMGDFFEDTVVMSRDGQTGVVLLSNNYEKKSMGKTYSTEQTAIDLYQQVLKTKRLK